MNLGRPDRSAHLDALAAGYALGTLGAGPRRRLARLAQRDPMIAAAIRDWELRLAALAEEVPGMTPPPRVWERIRDRLGLGDAPSAQPARGKASLWESLGLWRGLAIAGFALAFVLGIVMLAPSKAFESIVVVLAGPDQKPVLLATAERQSHYLTVKAIAAIEIPRDRALELWMLPNGRAPISLGLVPNAGIDRVALRAAVGTTLQDIPALAVSLEPAGGSRTGAPTGPVLYTGRVEKTY